MGGCDGIIKSMIADETRKAGKRAGEEKKKEKKWSIRVSIPVPRAC